MPRAAESDWLSWTKSMSIPAASSAARLQVSEKKPRASPCFFGRMTFTSGISSGEMSMAASWVAPRGARLGSGAGVDFQ